jgi:hypothetical protein
MASAIVVVSSVIGIRAEGFEAVRKRDGCNRLEGNLTTRSVRVQRNPLTSHSIKPILAIGSGIGCRESVWFAWLTIGCNGYDPL